MKKGEKTCGNKKSKGIPQRILASLLCVMLAAGNLSVTAYAKDGDGKAEEIAAPVPVQDAQAAGELAKRPEEADLPEEPSGGDDPAVRRETDAGLPAEETDESISREIVAGNESGSCGDNVSWEFDENTLTLTVSGEGAMTEAPWQNLEIKDNIKSVVIEDGVTEISQKAFERCAGLKSVVMEDTVQVVGSGAFNYSFLLQNLTLSKNLTRIDSSAFEGCQTLKTVSIPGGVTSIAKNAFAGCSALDSLKIQERGSR